MKIKSKFTLFTAFILIVFQLVVMFMIINHIRKKDSDYWINYKTEEMNQIKDSLKSYTDMAYALIESNHKNSINMNYMKKLYGHRLENIIDVIESMLKTEANKVKTGQISLEEAQSKAIKVITNLRYDNGTGYIWINDLTLPYPKMIMHPTIPELNGKILDNPKYNCALGIKKNLFQAFVEICKKDSSGFVNYTWPKPSSKGLIPDVAKLSYVREFKEWGWILGTGIYIDDAVKGILDNTKATIKKLRYNDGTGYFWINDSTKPIPRMIMHPILPSLDGQILADQKYNCPLGKGKFLFQEFLAVCNKSGSGYVEYFWSKPTKEGLIKQTPKISYVKLYKPLGWIVGTGFYLDTFDETMKIKQNKLNIQTEALVKKIKIIFLSLGIATILFLIITADHSSQNIKDVI